MIRTCIIRSGVGLASRRTFVTSSRTFNVPLTAVPISERRAASQPPLEASHFKDDAKPIVPQHEHTPQPKQVKSLTGDWVLFHPVYTPDENKAVKVLSRTPKTTSDLAALKLNKFARWAFDFVSRYKHKEIPDNHTMSLEELREGGYVMTESQWLARILFLESIAGVPGMVAAAVRHLRSLRLMKRDSGWIHTLLQEAENERMHLMTFMTLKEPGVFFRALILGAQGVFYNAFFLAYLLSSSTAHRFVACLEEEAVYTYTRLIQTMEAGHLPEWEKKPAPAIAIEYWRLPENATMLDVIYAVRSDESTHRFVNHSLASLEPNDINPFAMGDPSMHVKGTKIGFERDESATYVEESRKAMDEARREAADRQRQTAATV